MNEGLFERRYVTKRAMQGTLAYVDVRGRNRFESSSGHRCVVERKWTCIRVHGRSRFESLLRHQSVPERRWRCIAVHERKTFVPMEVH